MKPTLLFLLVLIFFNSFAQEIIVSFSGEIPETETLVVLDSVNVENLTQPASITLTDTFSLNLTSDENVSASTTDKKLEFRVYPNPFNVSTNIDFYIHDIGKVRILISNLTGQIVADWNKALSIGMHRCQFFPENDGIYLISVITDHSAETSKVISLFTGNNKSEIVYHYQTRSIKQNTILKSQNETAFPFSLGDVLVYTGYYADYISEIVDSPQVSTFYSFLFEDDSTYCWEIENWEGLLTDSQLLMPYDAQIPVVDSAIPEWLSQNENHTAIRSLTNLDNFEDFECLKELLKDKKIVMLGENDHRVKEYHLIKGRLVKFLHEEMGFNVLVFESDFYACNHIQRNLSNYTAEEIMLKTLWSSWVNTSNLALFDYIKSTQNTDQPLCFSGMDVQMSGSDSFERSSYSYQVISKLDSSYAEEVRLYEEYIADSIDDYVLTEYDEMKNTYNEYIRYLLSNTSAFLEISDTLGDDVHFLIQCYNSTLCYIDLRKLIFEGNSYQANNDRDAGMTENLRFILNRMYPDEKIIVWAHNAHIAYNQDIESFYGDFYNVGNLLYNDYRNDMYSIGFYMLYGDIYTANGIIPVVQPSSDRFLEAILYSLRKKYVFIDIENHPLTQGNEWMYTPIEARISGDFPEEIQLNLEYSGVVFVDSSSIPEFIIRDEELDFQ